MIMQRSMKLKTYTLGSSSLRSRTGIHTGFSSSYFLRAKLSEPPGATGTQQHQASSNEKWSEREKVTTSFDDVSSWESFANHASGEWNGVCGTFATDGEPRELPEYYVPQAYRDWDVRIHDWQTQCSVNCHVNGMSYKTRKLMPTVGCEEDAIAFIEDGAVELGVGSNTSNFAFDKNGMATISPGALILDTSVVNCQAEHIIPLEENGKRVRVVHLLKRMGSESRWNISAIEMHVENKEGPYTGRRELGGCGGGMKPFAAGNTVDITSIAETEWFEGHDGSQQSSKFPPTDVDIVLPLPEGCWTAWSCMDTTDGNVMMKFYTGVLSDRRDKMRVVTQSSIAGLIVESSMRTFVASQREQ